jgi:hypothetical protein
MDVTNKIDYINAEFKTRVLRLLNNYWDTLTQNGYISHTTILKKPLIDIKPLGQTWGQWLPEDRKIYLDEELILKGSWNSIKGVFAHEVAHQFVYEGFPFMTATTRGDSVLGHGYTFQFVCRLLKIDSFYTQATVDLKYSDAPPPTPYGKKRKEAEEHPILSKVKKLLALASSAETHESAAALSAAERLLSRHNLRNPNEKDGAEVSLERWLIRIGTSISYRHSLICHILSDFFFVNPIYIYEFDHKSETSYRTLELIGRPINLAMAEYVYHFLEERCATLWEAYKPKAREMGEKGISAKNAFISNLLLGFEAKLRNERKLANSVDTYDKTLSKETALILAQDETLIRAQEKERNEYMRQCHPVIRSSYRKQLSITTPLAAKAGWKAGKELTLHTPVGNTGASGPQKRLPGGQ